MHVAATISAVCMFAVGYQFNIKCVSLGTSANLTDCLIANPVICSDGSTLGFLTKECGSSVEFNFI